MNISVLDKKKLSKIQKPRPLNLKTHDNHIINTAVKSKRRFFEAQRVVKFSIQKLFTASVRNDFELTSVQLLNLLKNKFTYHCLCDRVMC